MPPAWPESYIAGISLTYDGARSEHLDEALPALEKAGIKGTFFIESAACSERLTEWRSVAELGHELGNGFLYSVVDEDGLVPHWPTSTLRDELQDAEDLCEALSGHSPESFAYPCVRTEWGSAGMPVVSDIVANSIVRINQETLEPLTDGYSFIRIPIDGFNANESLGPKRIHCYVADGLSGDSLCVAAHLGISQGAWTVFVFSAMRANPFDGAAHERLVDWLAPRKNSVWVAPVAEIGSGLAVPAAERFVT